MIRHSCHIVFFGKTEPTTSSVSCISLFSIYLSDHLTVYISDTIRFIYSILTKVDFDHHLQIWKFPIAGYWVASWADGLCLPCGQSSWHESTLWGGSFLLFCTQCWKIISRARARRMVNVSNRDCREIMDWIDRTELTCMTQGLAKFFITRRYDGS